MQAKIFKQITETVELNHNEELEVCLDDKGLIIAEYKVWSEAFDTWIKQDLDLLMKTYPTHYQELCDQVYHKYIENGGA